MTLLCDNQSSLAVVKDKGKLPKVTKHVDVRHHWVTDRIRLDELHVKYVESKSNIADMLTKPLEKGLLINLTQRCLLFSKVRLLSRPTGSVKKQRNIMHTNPTNLVTCAMSHVKRKDNPTINILDNARSPKRYKGEHLVGYNDETTICDAIS